MSREDDRKKRKRRAKRERAKQREIDKKRRHAKGLVIHERHYGENIGPTIQARDVETGELIRVNVGDLKDAPIRHSSLPADLLPKIRMLFQTVGRYVYDEKDTLEQWEVGFMRDAHPEREIGVWSRIFCAWKQYHVLFLNDEVRNYRYEQRLVQALIGISTGGDQLGVPPLVEQRLRECWKNPWTGDDHDHPNQ